MTDSYTGLERWSSRLERARSGDGFERQPFELLRAFDSIGDPVLREEIIILVEIISKHPTVVKALSAALLTAH